MAGTGPTEYDHCSPAMIDCWPYILDYIPDLEDIESLSKVSPSFAEMLYDIIFDEVVLPTFLKNANLPMDNILALRSLNSGTKKAVETFLAENPPQWLLGACRLSPQRPLEMNQFRNDFFPQLLRRPFLSKHLTLEVPVGDHWVEECCTFLQDFGHEIRILILILGDWQPANLSRLLSHLPVITSLHLRITGLPVENVVQQANTTRLPPLPELTSLKISIIPDPAFWQAHQLPLQAFFDLILLTYGAQLEKLLFDEPAWTTAFNNWDVVMSNMVYFELSDFIDGKLDIASVKFSLLRTRNLRTLILCCAGTDIHWVLMFLLYSIRTTLEELHLPRQDLNINYVPPDLAQNTFPNLKKLVAYNRVENGNWPVFKVLFPNLEELQFQPGTRLPRGDQNIPTPTAPRLRMFFHDFPLLKRLVWTGDRVGAGAQKVIRLRRPFE